MAFGAKFVVILVVGICSVESTTGCDDEMIEQCNDAIGDYGWPALLNVPADVREDFCNNEMTNLTECLDVFRGDCTFDESESFWSFENMGQFLCNDLDRYAEHYEVISNVTNQVRWRLCSRNLTLDGTESPAEGCGECEDTVECYVAAVEDEYDSTKVYIDEFGDAALGDYYAHYGCPSGSSAVRFTSGIFIASLLSLLWST